MAVKTLYMSSHDAIPAESDCMFTSKKDAEERDREIEVALEIADFLRPLHPDLSEDALDAIGHSLARERRALGGLCTNKPRFGALSERKSPESDTDTDEVMIPFTSGHTQNGNPEADHG